MSQGVFEEHLLKAQHCLEAMPVIVLGSGASIPYGLASMHDIKEHLRSTIDTSELGLAERQQWSELSKAFEKYDLEAALQNVQTAESLTRLIIQRTRDLIVKRDRSVFLNVVQDARYLCLSKLFQHLFNSTHSTLNVVTTNYDRLAEYAASAINADCFTGFTHGYIQRRSPPRESRYLSRTSESRTVNVWKVHGSIDWFGDENNVVYSLPSEVQCPEGLLPAMVTPGLFKYQQTHMDPYRTILTETDAILSKARGFCCVGYGFNDDHIHPKLVERARESNVPVLILTRSLTDATERFLASGEATNYVVFTEGLRGTRLISDSCREGVELSDIDVWALKSFLERVT